MNRTILALGLYLLAGSVRADVAIVGTPEHITANASIDEGVVIPTGANACTIEVVGHTANDGPIVGYLNFDDATDIIFTHVATASFAAQGLVSVYYILSTHGEWPGDNTTPTLSYTAAFNSYNQGHSALWTSYSGVDTSSPMVDTTGLTHANGAGGSAAITLTGVTSGDLTKIVARDTASAADVSINGQTASIEAGSAFNSV